AFEKAEDRREELIAAMAMPVGTEEEKEAKIQTVKAIYDPKNVWSLQLPLTVTDISISTQRSTA
ncbi:MAG: hypothetical protein IJ978_03275, partial [Clostridia bacterium]|nr:hypothetical protein [Clostridia bacterium]